MRIAITGAGGFLGRALLASATAAGHDLAVLGRRPAGVGRFLAVELESGAGLSDVEWRTFDAVVHLAAAGVKAPERDWVPCLGVNVVGTMRLLAAIARAGARPILWIPRTFYEDLAVSLPELKNDPYIATKDAANKLVRDWEAIAGFRVIHGRVFQLYGPGDHPKNVLTYAARQAVARKPALLGSGRSRRDWLYVADAAELILATLAHPPVGTIEWDVGSGSGVSIRSMVEAISDLVGAPRDLLQFDARRDRFEGEPQLTATRIPPYWRPRHDIHAGLVRLVEECQSELGRAKP